MKVEMEAHTNQQLERIAEFMKNNSKVSNSTGLEAENQRLKKQLNKEIKESRCLLNRLWLISKHLHKESGTSNEDLIGYIERTLKEFDYNPPGQNNEPKLISKTFTINLQDGEE